MSTRQGLVVVVDGPSSAGKTSLARALQARWPTPLILVSLDKVLAQLPFRYTGDGVDAAEGHAVRRVGGEIEIVVGPVGRRLDRLAGAHVEALVRHGFDVVVDYVFVDARMVQDVLGGLTGTRVLHVGLSCSDAELRARETARGDRLPGLALHLAHLDRAGRAYDLHLDSTDQTPDVLAERILAALG